MHVNEHCSSANGVAAQLVESEKHKGPALCGRTRNCVTGTCALEGVDSQEGNQSCCVCCT